MMTIARTLLAGKAATSAAALAGSNGLVRVGAGALAGRWAMRSIPTALGLLVAGAAVRRLIRRRRSIARPRLTGAPATPASLVRADATAGRAPDPRRHYPGPEDLREDVELDLATRESLLRQWKDEVDSLLVAEAEGMSASDPIRAEAEARLAAEARRVDKALHAVERQAEALDR